MSLLILLRHGQSTYNQEGKFTGTTDVPLTLLGEQQAADAGKILSIFPITKVFVSQRKRAIDTYSILAKTAKLDLVPVVDHRLNEQDFGDLEGRKKEELEAIFGEEKVLEWRRAFHAHPPKGERFMAVQARLTQFFNECLAESIRNGEVILLVAHGNSLRALAVHLLDLKLSEIPNFELPNAKPLVLQYHNITKEYSIITRN